MKTIHLFLPLLLLAACATPVDPSGSRAEGFTSVQRQGGPRVVWNVLGKPLPEIPLPNNAATRPDPTSPTGRRVNVSLEAARTRYEQRTRREFNKMDGFGAFGAITVRFDAPLSLPDLVTRHQQNDDFRDDAVFLLNVDKSCKRYGEEVALDFGRGRFPVTLMGRAARVADPQAPSGFFLDEGPTKFFPFDPHSETLNVLFDERNEDANGNGKLDLGEDLDDDGVLDVANLTDPHVCDAVPMSTPEHDRCIADHLMTWYERQTNTLILRPVWPLEERCTYAVVLTKRLKDAAGHAVESPFPEIAAAEQLPDLAPVPELLTRYGLTGDDVTFAWTFTIGTMTLDLEALRQGLYGEGPFARLGEEFPVAGFKIWTRDEWRALSEDTLLGAGNGGDKVAISGGCTTATWAAIGGTSDADEQICGGYADYAAIGTLFAGTFKAPDFLTDKDGRATPKHPDTDDETFDIDVQSGRATYGTAEPTFYCVLPRDDLKPAEVVCKPGNPDGQPYCKPYPVVFYAHGYASVKGEFIQHAGRHAQMGVAGCALDSYGHGADTALDLHCPGSVEFLAARAKLSAYGVEEMLTMIYHGRDRDLNNDGCPDGGADQWTANLFHTRDMVRQSVLEEMQFVRMLRAMDGKHKDAAGHVLGDVDGDGQPDLGGPNVGITAWGISLGGQLMGVLAGAEPNLDAVSPNAVGAGLTDISVRLGEGGLAEAVMLPVQGPLVVGCLPVDAHQNPLQPGAASPAGLCIPQEGTNGIPPQQPGELLVSWLAHDTARRAWRIVGRVPGVQPGDRVEVTNLEKNLTSVGHVSARGHVMVNIAADALSANERRGILGLKDGDYDAVKWPDTPVLGDRVIVRVYAGETATLRGEVKEFAYDTKFYGAIYPQGAPLVALQEGLGYARNTPDFRRFYSIAAHAVAPADPASWALRYFQDPFEPTYDPTWRKGRQHVLVMPVTGDGEVPVATGVSLGRSSGLFGSFLRDESVGPEHGWRQLFVPDARFGMSIEEWLRTNFVIEGDWRMQRWNGFTYNPNVLFDADNVSDGTIAFSCKPSDDWSAEDGEFRCPAGTEGNPPFSVPHPAAGKELRITRARPDDSFDAFRVPMQRPAGQHGIYNPQPFRRFDSDAYMVNFTARFLRSAGRAVEHVVGCDCSYVKRPHYLVNGQPAGPGLENVEFCPDDNPRYGKACSPDCAKVWGLATVPTATCAP